MIFTANNIVKQYPRSKFQLHVPNVTLSEGAIVGVVGENGNGKTTLLNIIAGELEANGSLNYFGEDVGSRYQLECFEVQNRFYPAAYSDDGMEA